MSNGIKLSIIVPTLNEERTITNLLKSVNSQHHRRCSEVIIVDGGSIDRTAEIARKYGAKVVVYNGLSEFASRNKGARIANGDILIFTCADIIFPQDLLKKVVDKFEKDPQLTALSGPGVPYDAPLKGSFLYAVYNMFRFLLSKLPKPLKRFSTSTNFLVVRRTAFEKTGGFDSDDINADGLIGRKLLQIGMVEFSLDTFVYISARRMKKMGFIKFIFHYLYVLENFFPFLSYTKLIKSRKLISKSLHRKLHDSEKLNA
jgi:glycosyltransferase involved in cell wall biosynthesis